MSYQATRLVRATEFPKKSGRAIAKAVLLSLADDCTGDPLAPLAFTSVPTMEREAAVSARTIDAALANLKRWCLASEHAPPRQHKPRTWRLNIPAIVAMIPVEVAAKLPDEDQSLIAAARAKAAETAEAEAAAARKEANIIEATDPQPSATLNESGPQPTTTLAAPAIPVLDPQPAATLNDSESQSSASGSQDTQPGSQPTATERLNGVLNVRTAPQTARFTDKAREPNGNNRGVIAVLAYQVFDEHQGRLSDSDFVEAVKQRCAQERVDYGRHDDVSFREVAQACSNVRRMRALGAKLNLHERTA